MKHKLSTPFLRMRNKINKRILSAVLFSSLLLFFRESLSNEALYVYSKGTKLCLRVSWWGLSAHGTMEVLNTTKFRDKETILVRSQVSEVGGFLGFIVKFIRIYKESNTFDSYIDTNTLMSIRYEVYKLDKNGTKKVNEHVYFDRKSNKIISLEDNKVIINNADHDVQDTFSIFLSLLNKLKNESLFVGKKISVNLYAYKKISKVDIKVISKRIVSGKDVYTLEIKEIPEIFKYPTSIEFEVAEDEKGNKFPTKGKCIIDVPVIGNIEIDGELIRLN